MDRQLIHSIGQKPERETTPLPKVDPSCVKNVSLSNKRYISRAQDFLRSIILRIFDDHAVLLCMPDDVYTFFRICRGGLRDPPYGMPCVHRNIC